MRLAAKIAAEWWTNRLEQGDKEKFAERLAVLIDAALNDLEHQSKRGVDDEVVIKVDYDPDDMLLDALKASGVECRGCMFSARDILPLKTMLCVSQTRLRPKEGYGNWVDEIEVPRAELLSSGVPS